MFPNRIKKKIDKNLRLLLFYLSKCLLKNLPTSNNIIFVTGSFPRVLNLIQKKDISNFNKNTLR